MDKMDLPVIKNSQLTSNGIICPICLALIHNPKGDDIIKCSGFCQRVMHRSCAVAASLKTKDKQESEPNKQETD
jgi:hypothetical protein